VRMRVEIDTNIIKACEARSINILHAVVGDQEALFPSHEHSARVAVHRQVWGLELVLDMTEGGEAGPMYHVTLLIGTPPPGQKAISTADDFSIKISRELRPVICKPPDAEIATEERGREVDIHYGDGHIITIAPALLGTLKCCARIETVVGLRPHANPSDVNGWVWSG